MTTKILNTTVMGMLLSGVLAAPVYAGVDDFEGQESIIYQKEMMKVMDTNGDKKISKNEYMKMHTRMAEKKFMMMDMNDDGFLSDIEYGLGTHDS